MGGIHDRLRFMSKYEIIDYITNQASKHQELYDVNYFRTVIAKPSILKLLNLPQKFGGLHDYINTLNRSTLIAYAFAAEQYHQQANNTGFLIGGLHDYISTLLNEEIVEHIMFEINEHPELDSSKKMDELCSTYGIDENSLFDQNGPVVTSFLNKMTRKQLDSYALASEQYDRDSRRVHLLGGLHDYISTLSNDQVKAYIVEKVEEYPELQNPTLFSKVVNKYGTNQQ